MVTKNKWGSSPIFRRLLPFFACVLAACMLASCTQSNPIPPSQIESSQPISSQPVESQPEAPPYGEPIAPNAVLAEKLAQTFKLGDPKGWLTIPGTTVDHAVLYNSEDNSFVKTRSNYDGKYDFAGILFADFRNTLADRTRLSRNTVVYGHNIETNGSSDGKHFSQLLKFEDLQFAKENQFISFSTKDDEMLWQIFAVFTTDIDFYYIEPEPTDEGLMYIVSEASVRSEHHYDVDITPQDKILTLSTCTYKYGRFNTDQRFVVMAKLLPGTEGTPVEVYKNENPKLPSFVK